MFIPSLCSHVCRYQPPQCVLKCLRVSIAKCFWFPQSLDVSQFERISRVWFVAFPFLFQVFPGCLECFPRGCELLISDDVEGLSVLCEMSINAALKWWRSTWFIKGTILLSNSYKEVAQKPVQFCWWDVLPLLRPSMFLTPLIPFSRVTLSLSFGVYVFLLINKLFNIFII